MYKSMLSFCVIGCMSTSVFAANSFMSLLHSKQNNLLDTQKMLSHEPSKSYANFTDFSGNWSGTCTSDNDLQSPMEITSHILNTDSSITFDDVSFAINGITTTSTSTQGNYSTEQTKFYWDSNHQTLTMDSIYIYNNYGLSSDMNMPKYFEKTTFTLKNMDLIMKSTFHDNNKYTEHMKCILKKTNN